MYRGKTCICLNHDCVSLCPPGPIRRSPRPPSRQGPARWSSRPPCSTRSSQTCRTCGRWRAGCWTSSTTSTQANCRPLVSPPPPSLATGGLSSYWSGLQRWKTKPIPIGLWSQQLTVINGISPKYSHNTLDVICMDKDIWQANKGQSKMHVFYSQNTVWIMHGISNTLLVRKDNINTFLKCNINQNTRRYELSYYDKMVLHTACLFYICLKLVFPFLKPLPSLCSWVQARCAPLSSWSMCVRCRRSWRGCTSAWTATWRSCLRTRGRAPPTTTWITCSAT